MADQRELLRGEVEPVEEADGWRRGVSSISGTLVVPGDGGQHVGLEVGLVLPHPTDDRRVGQLDAGGALDVLEDPLEGEVVGAGLDPLRLQDLPSRPHDQGPQLVAAQPRLALSVNGPTGAGTARRPVPLHAMGPSWGRGAGVSNECRHAAVHPIVPIGRAVDRARQVTPGPELQLLLRIAGCGRYGSAGGGSRACVALAARRGGPDDPPPVPRVQRGTRRRTGRPVVRPACPPGAAVRRTVAACRRGIGSSPWTSVCNSCSTGRRSTTS